MIDTWTFQTFRDTVLVRQPIRSNNGLCYRCDYTTWCNKNEPKWVGRHLNCNCCYTPKTAPKSNNGKNKNVKTYRLHLILYSQQSPHQKLFWKHVNIAISVKINLWPSFCYQEGHDASAWKPWDFYSRNEGFADIK